MEWLELKPDITYYFGRAVETVEQKHNDWQWVIVLEGNVRISNHDKRYTTAPDIVGMSLNGAAYDGSYLDFSGQQITVNPAKMSIAAPDMDDPDEVEEDALPPDPSVERIATRPTGPIGPTDHPGGNGPGPTK